MNARFIALIALSKVSNDNAYSNIVLNNEIKKTKLSKTDTSFVTRLFYGVLEKRITLDYVISLYSNLRLEDISFDILEILRLGTYQILFMERVPDSAAVNESVNLVIKLKKVKSKGFVNAILREIVRNKDNIEYPNDSIKYSCPKWLINLWVKSYGKSQTQSILKSLSGRPDLTVRMNNLKGRNEGMVRLENTGSIENMPEFKNGEFHVQDKASQICCEVLDPRPGETIVDVCAAPGGKSFTIAEMMQNRGQVFAYDLYESKVNLIEKGAERLGITIIKSEVRDAQFGETKENFADKVLCDVPCSGLGIIRRKPEIRYKEQRSFNKLPNIQYDILLNSSKFLKLNGFIIYSTCTLNPKENDDVVEKFLVENKNFKLRNKRTIFPEKNNSDGFFIACFQKVDKG